MRGTTATLLSHREGVQIEYQGAPGVTVLARPGELEQVVFNVFLNAAQAMGGSGTIETRTRKENGHIVLAIRDTGPGISKPDLLRLFQPFVQADSSKTRSHDGAGLGLAITRRLARAMDGEVTAASEIGKGSVFTLYLRAAAESAARAAA